MTTPTYTKEQCVEWLKMMLESYSMPQYPRNIFYESILAYLTPPATPDDPTCPHGKPLHQDCFTCDELSATPAHPATVDGADWDGVHKLILSNTTTWKDEKEFLDAFNRLRTADLAKDKAIERLREALEKHEANKC